MGFLRLFYIRSVCSIRTNPSIGIRKLKCCVSWANHCLSLGISVLICKRRHGTRSPAKSNTVN